MKILTLIVFVCFPALVFSREPFWCLGGHVETFMPYYGNILDIDVTPDNNYFISSGMDATIRLFNIANGNMIASLDNGLYYVESLHHYEEAECFSFAISKDSKYVISDNGYVYSIPEGKLIRRLKDTTYPRNIYIDRASNEDIIAIGSGYIRDINYITDEVKKEVKLDANISFRDHIINHKGDKIVSYDNASGELSVVSLTSGKVLSQKKVYNNNTFINFVIDPSDRYIYAKDTDINELLVIDINTLDVSDKIKLSVTKTNGLSLSPDGKHLFMNVNSFTSNSLSQALYKYNINDFKNPVILNFPGITRINFLSDGEHAVITNWQGTISSLMNYNNMKIERSIISHSSAISHINFSADDKYITTIELPNDDYSYELQIFDIDQRTQKFTYFIPMQNATDVNDIYMAIPFTDFSSDGRFMISTGGAIAQNTQLNSIYLFDFNQDTLYRELRGHSEPITKAIFSNEGNSIISVATDKTIRIWDIESGNEINKIDFQYKLMNISESIDGKSYYLVNLYDNVDESSLFKYEKETQELTKFNFDIWSAYGFPAASQNSVFSTDKRYFAFESGNIVNVFDLVSEQIILSIPFTNPVHYSFTKDNRFLSIVGDSAKIEIWDIAQNKKKADDFAYPYKSRFNNGRPGMVCPPTNRYCSFANNKNLFAICTDDASAVIWDYSDITVIEKDNQNPDINSHEVSLRESVISNNLLELIFLLKKEENVKIQIVDCTGNTIEHYNDIYVSPEEFSFRIDLRNYLTGSYYCRIFFNDRVEILKFLVIP